MKVQDHKILIILIMFIMNNINSSSKSRQNITSMIFIIHRSGSPVLLFQPLFLDIHPPGTYCFFLNFSYDLTRNTKHCMVFPDNDSTESPSWVHKFGYLLNLIITKRIKSALQLSLIACSDISVLRLTP